MQLNLSFIISAFLMGGIYASREQFKEDLIASFHKIFSTPEAQHTADLIPVELNPLMPYMRDFNLVKPKKLTKDAVDVACVACEAGVTAIIDLFLLGGDLETIENVALGVCVLFGIEEREVCRGYIWNFGPQLEWILNNASPRPKANEICAILMGKGCGAWEEVNSWTVPLPHGEKPEVQTPEIPPAGSPTYKILHLSDVHLDLNYTIGSDAECGLMMCCTNGSTPSSPGAEAGYWGEYNCDLPHWTFKHMLEHIKETHQGELEYIMLTGDYPAHDTWLQSRDINLAHTKKAVDLINEILPGVLVLPSLGNHESFPCNSWPTHAVDGYDNPNWLYNSLGDYFSSWLPEETIDQFKQEGSYSILLREGFRVISINSNMCLTINFFLFMNWVDPGNLLHWLVEELTAAEMAREKVHIISHNPPGNGDCLGAWGREFSKIIDRFENTVVNQFYGHTHNDEFAVFYDAETNSRPTNVAFVAPSVTTIGGLNPAYRIYTVDAGRENASFRVLESETYIFNLVEANLVGSDSLPTWFQLYSATQDLEMETLFPKDWDILARRLVDDQQYFEKFFRFYNQDSFGEEAKNDKRAIICALVTTSNIDTRKCEELMGPSY